MVITLGREADPRKRIRKRQGDTIRKVRQLRGLSIEEFAKAVAVTSSAVSQWETGRFTPRQEMQVRIARALDVPWSTIFGLDAEVA
jgi:transcriptional regulator with XRE-family HTH domain